LEENIEKENKKTVSQQLPAPHATRDQSNLTKAASTDPTHTAYTAKLSRVTDRQTDGWTD